MSVVASRGFTFGSFLSQTALVQKETAFMDVDDPRRAERVVSWWEMFPRLQQQGLTDESEEEMWTRFTP